MTALRFNDGGWDVITSSWTAASKKPSRVTICYTWGVGGIGWTSQATGTASVDLGIEMGHLAFLVAKGGVVDLRSAS